MSGSDANARLTRRTLLARGTLTAASAVAGTGVLAGALNPAAALAGGRLPRWTRPASTGVPGLPSGPLPLSAAAKIDPNQFASGAMLTQWLAQLDEIGLRATGSDVHHRYADSLAARLEAAGVSQVTSEGVPLRRWTPGRFSLELIGGVNPGPLPVASYVPYSGITPPGGVSGPLALLTDTAGFPGDITLNAPAGSIGIVQVQGVPVPILEFDQEDWGAPHQPTHRRGYSPLTLYDRAWLDQGNVEQALVAYQGKGLAGLIFILDLPAEAAKGMYMPYHGVIYDTPALFVDRNTGSQVIGAALTGGHAQLTLEASAAQITTPNVYGVIPGASEELVILESHHDGTNGLEENGCEAIVAIAHYLARLPRCALPRTVLLLCATGHFAGNALGCTDFIVRHKDDLIARTAAAITIEHLGALEWLPNSDGVYEKTGNYEFGGFFAAPFDAVINPCRAALVQAQVTEDRVMKPFSAGSSPDGEIWPGDGQPLWAVGGLPSANFITGPNYLLNADMRVFDLLDVAAFRRQAIAFGDLIMNLTGVPLAQLQKRRADDEVVGPSDTSPGSSAEPAACRVKRHKGRKRRKH